MMLLFAMVLPNGFDLIAFTDTNRRLIESLAAESTREGFAFVQRTIDNWDSGTNCFSRPGEGLWGLVSSGSRLPAVFPRSSPELIGIGGLNIDPYVADAGIGRVRHLYIRQAYRRKGCATFLMNTIIGQARLHFRLLRLYTDNPVAAAFYERLGFEHMPGDRVSHVMGVDS